MKSMQFVLLFICSLSQVWASDLFWKYWSDGNAEIAAYDLQQERYGQTRKGQAVLIFVTEPFSRSANVKVNEYDPSNKDHFVALKLNFLKKFQTGIYDYSLMTSVFTDPISFFDTVKISFSSQEWCGQTYHELIFKPAQILSKASSYFEGESKEEQITRQTNAWPEDLLWIALRQLSAKELDVQKNSKSLLTSLERTRLRHKPLETYTTEIHWSEPKWIEVPAGSFEVREAAWKNKDGKECKMWIESAYPHKIIGWIFEGGESAKMLGAERLPYWQLNKNGAEQHLQKLGLHPNLKTP